MAPAEEAAVGQDDQPVAIHESGVQIGLERPADALVRPQEARHLAAGLRAEAPDRIV